jgi:hypothetical protein
MVLLQTGAVVAGEVIDWQSERLVQRATLCGH